MFTLGKLFARFNSSITNIIRSSMIGNKQVAATNSAHTEAGKLGELMWPRTLPKNGGNAMINISSKAAYFIKLESIYLFLSLFIGGIKVYEYDLSKGIDVFLYVSAFMQIVIVATNFRLIFNRDR